jgi:hypothetical protein
MFEKLQAIWRRRFDNAGADCGRPFFRRRGVRRSLRRVVASLAAAALLPAGLVLPPFATAQECYEEAPACEECEGFLAQGWRGLLHTGDSLDSGYSGLIYSVPSMMGNTQGPFATAFNIESFAATPIFATYTGATSQFVNVNQPVTFAFTSVNPNPLLPDIAGATSVPPALDNSGDGQLGTFVGLPEDFALTQVVAANTPFPGTVTFQNGQAVFVSNASILFQSQSLGSDPSVLLPEVDGSVAAAEVDPNFNGYQLQYFYLFNRAPFVLQIPYPTSTSLTGRTKIAQNGSVVPRTRAFFDYALTENEQMGGNFTFQRFTPGIERAFFGGLTSLELRMPIVLSSGAEISADNPFSEGDGEFGNVSLAVKALMIRMARFAFSGGMQLTLPTASNTNVRLADGTSLVHVKNESVHVMPFLGAVYDGRLFYSQLFAQVDIDANGNALQVNPTLAPGAALVTAPDLYDTDQFYLDWATGLWLYRAPDGPRGPLDLVAVAPTVEVHYTQGLGTPASVRVGSVLLGNPGDTTERVDVLAGGSAILQGGTITAGFGAPLTGDQTHDWEFRLLINHALR